MSAIQVVTPPAAEPVTVELAKNHLRVTIGDDDQTIALYIQAARQQVEQFLARSLVTKTYRQSLDSFPYFTDTVMSQMAYPPSYYALPRYSTTLWNYSQMIKLYYSPLVRVLRIAYLSSGDSQWHDLLPAPFGPQPSTVYTLGEQFEDPNGNLQQITAVSGAGVSGSAMPSSWGSAPGDPTTWGDLTVTCQGEAPAGDFIYDSESEPPRIFPLAGQYWPSVLYVPNAVQIYYTAGYGDDGSNVPPLANVAILQTVAHWYENRESVSPDNLKDVPGNMKEILWSLRVLDLAPTRG